MIPKHLHDLYVRALLFPAGLWAAACGEAATPAGSAGTIAGTGTTTEPGTAPFDPSSAGSGDATPTTSGVGTGGTGGEPGSGEAGTGATTGFSGCGDGVVDADEECDDSLEGNGDHNFCTAECTINVCGDGKLLVGWEICDEGDANSDEYGSLCGTQCEPGARCGDGKLQASFETCDLGPDNGGEMGDEQGILCDASCRALRLRAFVSEAAFDGALGGLFGADLKCQAAAKAAGLAQPERFHAFLSSGDVDAKDRFAEVAATRPYVLVTGKKIAESFAALVAAGPLAEGISVTEHGTALYLEPVATNTAPGGLKFSPDQHCQGWTSAEPAYVGRTGLSGVAVDSPDFAVWQAEQLWVGAKSWVCSKSILHLYCLEM